MQTSSRIHLAEIGYTYQMMPSGIRVSVRFIAEPTTTLCGKSTPLSAIAVIAPHDHRSCRACLDALPKKTTDHVRALLFPRPDSGP